MVQTYYKGEIAGHGLEIKVDDLECRAISYTMWIRIQDVFGTWECFESVNCLFLLLVIVKNIDFSPACTSWYQGSRDEKAGNEMANKRKKWYIDKTRSHEGIERMDRYMGGAIARENGLGRERGRA